MAATTSLFLILSALLLSLTPSTTRAQISNVMVTGDTLPNTGRLTYDGTTSFIMQDDCNLVLYNGHGGFQSNTANNGKGCTLRLDDRGIFRIQDNTGKLIWNSVPDKSTPTGEYVAVVRPDGEVAVYGPQRYSSKEERLTSTITSDQTAALPTNVLFSGEIVNRRNSMTAGSAILEMGADCRLVLRSGNQIIWTPPSFIPGDHCFARLDHRGRIRIVDDEIRYVITLPTSNERFEEGEYVLVLKSDGVFGVYGPVVWATPRPKHEVQKISMMTGN